MMLGSLVSTFIYLGLFFGLFLFVVCAIALIYIIVNFTIDIEDQIKAKRAARISE